MEESRSGFDSSSSSSGESVKLFVGQVPKNMNEDELLSIFKEIALIDEINIIKDKLTRTSRGCCFLICPSRQEADKAVNAFHNKKTLPGASTPLQVKYADGELERLEHKLFVGMLPKNVTDVEVSTLFSKYGNIKELQILRGSQQTSKGCAFLKYETKEQAVSALDAINGKYKMEGSSVPLVVKWADTEKERQARKAQKAMASGVSSTNPAQQPSLFGALPMNHLPLYNGFGYQAPGSYGLMQYPHGIRGLSPDLAARISPRNFPPVPSSNYIRPRFPAIPGLRYPISSAGVQAEGPPGANLFIYHIPQEFGDQELANAFKQFGTVLSAKVFVDKATGVSKCFGFVSYDSPNSAQSAISEMNGYQLGGKKLKVQIKRENKTSKPF